MSFIKKKWKKGDKLTSKEMNRIENGIGGLDLGKITINPTLPDNSDFNNLGEESFICPLSTFSNYINGPTYDSDTETSEPFTGMLIQVCFNPGPAIFQFVVNENGPIYTRVRTMLNSVWRDWNALTSPIEVDGTP